LSRGRSVRQPNGAPDCPSPSGRLRPKRVSLSYSRDDIAAHAQRIRDIPPAQR
jgi:hypothetical protein